MNANQRLDPTPPGYNPLPPPPLFWRILIRALPLKCTRTTTSNSVASAHAWAQYKHMHTRTHTCVLCTLPVHTKRRAQRLLVIQKPHVTLFVLRSILFLLFLFFLTWNRWPWYQNPFSKRTFMDSTVILNRPRFYPPCWRGTEDQLCRFVECWWAFTPQRIVLSNSYNPELEECVSQCVYVCVCVF